MMTDAWVLFNAANASDNDRGISANISIANGKIAAADGDHEVFDANGATVLPGFIDVHIHGAVGVDVNEADVDGLLLIADFLARHGVTSWVPTLVPDSEANYKRVIDSVDRLIEVQKERPVAQAVGIHYEGIFANEKMCGALRPEYFRSFPENAVLGLPRLRSGRHMTTFAPEIEGGIRLAKELKAQGWIPSVGHTRADLATLELACDAGASHVTHFFNAMTGIHHREVGVAGWALTEDRVTFDIIADGRHVAPKMLKMACQQKTPDRSILISDSVAPTGLGDGDYELWGETINVTGGITKNERGSIAGSVITMHDAVVKMLDLGFSYEDAAKMASRNPARLLGLDDDRGWIAPGMRADLVGLQPNGQIAFVMIGGKFVR